MLKYRTYISLLLGLWLSFGLSAQGWEQTYGDFARDVAEDILASPDGGFYIVGSSASFSNGDQDVYLIKTDPDGVEEWHATIGDSQWGEYANSIQFTSDGNLIIGGTATQADLYKIYLAKVDLLGNVIWTMRSNDDYVEGRSVVELPSGEFMVCGERSIERIDNNGIPYPDYDIYLLKVGPNSLELSGTPYGGVQKEEGYQLINGAANSVFVLGSTRSEGAGQSDIYLLEIETQTGAVLRDTTYGTEFEEHGYAFTATTDGGYAITGFQDSFDTNYENVFLLKLNSTLDVDWFNIYTQSQHVKAWAIAQTPTGYVMAGEFRYLINNKPQVFVLKTDANGIKLNGGGDIYGGTKEDVAKSIALAPNGAYVLAGRTKSYGTDNSIDAYVLKIDASGFSFSNFVYGNVYTDFDLNCERGSSEIGIPEWVVKATGPKQRYALTDSAGNYRIALAEGTYLIEPFPPSSYWDWQLCGSNDSIHLSGSFDSIAVNFPVQTEIDCPLLSVNISTPFLRRCHHNIYSVEYCNTGTELASNASIDIHFDPYFTINSADLPYTNNGQIYTFQVGDLDLFDCGRFQIRTTLNCDSTVTGQTHCVEAHIYPDTICQPIDPNWDGSSIEVDAVCQGDSVTFTIKNVGQGDMQEISDYVIIEDYIVLLTGNIHLLSQQDTTIVVHPNGGSLRLEAGQSQGHPGFNDPSISVEGCGGFPFSTGYVTQLPQNDGNPFIDIDCQESIASFDPNDKNAFPKGYEEEHYIHPNTDLEYLIRFQNTGSDTAFRVVIRDTISNWLDLSSIQVGVASHPYTFDLYGEGILKFTFDNIQLPDSSVNEPASHGFIKFSIAQKPNNPNGTMLYNLAGIYFDYNEPVLTNQTFHKVRENFIIVDPPTVILELESLDIQYYPNPFTDYVTFELANAEGFDLSQINFSLYDLQGRLLRRSVFGGNTFTFEREGLSSGLYLFRIEQEGILISSGKLVIGR